MTSSGDLDEAAPFEFFDEGVDAADAHAQRFGQSVLSWKAHRVVPGVAQEQRVGCLRADRDVWVAQDEIRQLGKPVQRNRIGAVDFDVLFDLGEVGPDVVHRASIGPEFPALSVINS